MNATYHKVSPADQVAMQAMRAELLLHPALEFGPEARPVYDQLIARTPPADNVTYEPLRSAECRDGGAGRLMSSKAQRSYIFTEALTSLDPLRRIATSLGKLQRERMRLRSLQTTGLPRNTGFPVR